MRIAIIGAGALGTLFAEGLANVADLILFDRKLRTEPRGDAEAALVCVKSAGTAWAADVAARALAPGGVAVTLQNGLGHLETLARVLGPRRSAQGATSEGGFFRDGKIVRASRGQTYLAPHPRDLASRPRLIALAGHLLCAGFAAEVVDDARDVVWRKLVANAAINPVTALLRIPNGALLDHAAAATADSLARETAAVARALGIAIADDEATRLWREVAARTRENRSSMLQDVERALPTEIDAICGAIAREGARLGVPTPLSATMANLLG